MTTRTTLHRVLALTVAASVVLSAGVQLVTTAPAEAAKNASIGGRVWDARTGLNGVAFGGKVYASGTGTFAIGSATKVTAGINPLAASKSYIAKKYPASPAKAGYPRFETVVSAHQKPYATGAWVVLGSCEATGDTTKTCTLPAVTKPAVVLLKADAKLVTWSSGKRKVLASTHKEWSSAVTLPSSPLGIPVVTQSQPPAGPSLTLPPNTASTTYSSMGTVAEGQTVRVYAKLTPGYDPVATLPSGWSKAPAGSPGEYLYLASFTTAVVLGKPTVRQDDGLRQRAAVRAPANTACVTYRVSGTTAPGRTVTLTARLSAGCGVHGAPPAGWRPTSDSATFTYPVKLKALHKFTRASVTIRPVIRGQKVIYKSRVKTRPTKGATITYRWYIGKKAVNGKAGRGKNFVATKRTIGKKVHVKVTIKKRWYQARKIRSNKLLRLS